jgi:hypothetical protein
LEEREKKRKSKEEMMDHRELVREKLGFQSAWHGMAIDIQHLDGFMLARLNREIRSHIRILTYQNPIFLYLHNLIRVPESLAARIHGVGLDDVEKFGGVLTVPPGHAGFWKKRRNPDISQADE